ncbi:type IV secretion system protein [Bartonella gabonensis]|uniref:type IV secretion system protein n=1 Tax=Bartonella gabonensis TaxID=2699889 RepID=UPI0015884383|nr:type IV secretion system protein [Bartonella gabonensis]
MKKQFIITGMIAVLGMPNLAHASNIQRNGECHFLTIPFETDPNVPLPPCTQSPSSSSPTPSPAQSPAQSVEYSEIIKLLKAKIADSEEQLKKTEELYKAITGSKIQKPTIGEGEDFFLKDSHLIYPKPERLYQTFNPQFRKWIHVVDKDERTFSSWIASGGHSIGIRSIINKRLEYNSIIAKVVSLQTFQEAEKRSLQIISYLSHLSRAKHLKETFQIKSRIGHISTMIQNEHAKLQMVRNLNMNEKKLIEIQKRKLYQVFYNASNQMMPDIL